MSFHEGNSGETTAEEQAILEHIAEAKKLLILLGEERLIGKTFSAPDGTTLLAEEFPRVYKDKKGFYMTHVHPFYVAIETNPTDEELKAAVRHVVYSHLGIVPETT